MKHKLSRIHTRWRRIAIRTFLSLLVFAGRFQSRRAQIHWVGRADRPRRYERALFSLTFFLSMFLFEPREYALWSTVWGGTMAIFINLHTVYRLFPRKRYHWIRS